MPGRERLLCTSTTRLSVAALLRTPVDIAIADDAGNDVITADDVITAANRAAQPRCFMERLSFLRPPSSTKILGHPKPRENHSRRRKRACYLQVQSTLAAPWAPPTQVAVFPSGQVTLQD